ncbi:hypothetical protein LINGRAPRIM_LOCUS2874 [Linum grandiflorum]
MLRDNISWTSISDKLETRNFAICCQKWSGEVCRKRWNEMVKHLGDCKNKLFSEQVDILAKRYCSDVLEAREAYYSKPVVD